MPNQVRLVEVAKQGGQLGHEIPLCVLFGLVRLAVAALVDCDQTVPRGQRLFSGFLRFVMAPSQRGSQAPWISSEVDGRQQEPRCKNR
jgi:hypothetical protein